DHTTPFADRWGGWYVTARRGEPADRANAVAANPADPHTLVRESGLNRASLVGRIDPSRYLGPTSDIVALMVFEHQTQMTNPITRLGWQARLLPAAQVERGELPPGVAAEVDELVAYMLFSGEARLAAPIEGASTFARTFAAAGPRDRQGRSLRDLD